MFQANYIRCINSPDNDNCKVTVWMIISFDVRLRQSNPIDFVHLTQLYGLFFKYWEVISIHNWDLCLYHRYLVPIKKVADASTVGSPSQWKIYVLFDIKYDRHKLYQKNEVRVDKASTMTPQYDFIVRIMYSSITRKILFQW